MVMIMETKEMIQKRIKDRKTQTNVNKRNFPIYKFLMSFLTLTSLCLSFLIYTKHDNDRANLLANKIGLNIDFSKINSNISSYFDSVVGLNFLKKSFYEDDKEVSSNSNYLFLGEDYFTSDDNSIYALDGGVVVYIVENDGLYDVTIAYDNNYSIVYSNVDELFVDTLDRIEIDDVIAKFSEKFKMIILKDGKKVSYDEIYS